MVVSEINKEQVIQLMRQTLELPHSNEHVLDEVLLAASIRRAAAFLCPCSETTLLNTLCASLSPILDDELTLLSKLQDAINKLFIGGDLLELSDVSVGDINAKGTWIFAAPPAFITRPNGNIFIFGITPDENSPIPSLSSRIDYEGYKRILRKQENEDLESTLRDLGLVQVSDKAWFKLPKVVAPDKYMSELSRRFSIDKICGSVSEYEIIDHQLPNNFYRKRWVKPKDQTGLFVGRRPQVFGSPIWGLFEISQGNVTNFIDLPLALNGVQQRGCDTAWHCQLAIDHLQGQAQKFRMRDYEQGVIFDFFSPIPLWAERRLNVIGHSTRFSDGLFSYFIPKDEVPAEVKFLTEYLWMKTIT
jgi:hypothetical protein